MYYFEYDKSGNLYEYTELDSEKAIIMKCFVTGDTVIKYEKEDDYNYKTLTKYDTNVKMFQRFEAGESWLTVSCYDDFVEKNCSDNYTTTPDIKKRIQIENGDIIEYKISVEPDNVDKWKSFVGL